MRNIRSINILGYDIAVNYKFDKTPDKKTIISTLNAHSWVVASKNALFKQAIINSDVVLPDGVGIVLAARILNGEKITKLAGADLHQMVIENLNKTGGKCFYLGASSDTLKKIETRLHNEFPNILTGSYSPPYKKTFSKEENRLMIEKINTFAPDVLFVGMTAPKQEMWLEENKDKIDAKLMASIGAVFDFFSGTKKRAPKWMINLWMESLYRQLSEPKRVWRRSISTFIFLHQIFRAKMIKTRN